MKIDDSYEANTPSRHDGLPSDGTPADERLIDYLLGESAGDDPAIEHWLAADRANVARLERLAEAVVVASAIPGWSSDRHSDSGMNASGGTQQLSSPTGPGQRRVVFAILALAASVLIAIFWQGLTGGRNDPDTQIAIAWAQEVTDDRWDAPGDLAAGADLLADRFNQPAVQESERTFEAMVDQTDEENLDPTDIDPTDIGPADIELMADDDPPPSWLVLAFAQMASDADGEGSYDTSDEAFR
jgi:hypothetical protein